MGYNVGREVYGKGDKFRRPVLVLNAFKNGMFFGIPLSSKTKNKTGFMFYKFKDSQNREQVALFGQARHFDIKRIFQYMGKVNKTELGIIRKKFAENKSELIDNPALRRGNLRIKHKPTSSFLRKRIIRRFYHKKEKKWIFHNLIMPML